jgi:1-deoxy-D-xylulose-5-phosphate synthase
MDRSRTQLAIDEPDSDGGDVPPAPASAPRGPLLPQIDSPAQIRRLDAADMERLAAEMRSFLIDSVGRTGGHLGAGLGVVELTLALHAEFDFNEHDKLVWDVGHQAYPHKLLTGRRDGFASLRQWGGMSGFPDPAESPYDTVKTGHGGTSISTAMGFALTWALRHEDSRRHAIAVIGDGSLQEGSAYEALNHAGSYARLPLIVVLNDNGISISPSVGALEKALAPLRNGGTEEDAIGVRAFFEELGFSYFGPLDGHDIERLRLTLRTLRHWPRPAFVHVVTRKGKGYRDDVPERTGYHAMGGSGAKAPVALEYPEQGGPTFSKVFADHVEVMAERDPRVHVITAAMLEGTGLVGFHERHPDRCHDAGMAEQHAVGLAAGMALAGDKPVCAIYSTFLQRAYDQVFQEVSLQNAKVLFCMDRGGLVGSDGATHNGVYDISYLRCLPNFALLAPRDGGELLQMMDMADSWDGPVAIRFPRGAGAAPDRQLPHQPFRFGEAEQVADGDAGALFAYGTMTYVALEVRRRVEENTGRRLAVVNARFAKPLDESLLGAHWRDQPFVFTLEDHAIAGGFGAAVAELGATGRVGHVDAARLTMFGIPDRFVDHGERPEQLASIGLDADAITARVLALLRR